jgi:hypothetical protein
MRACMENLAMRLSATEADLVCTARRASAIQILSTQLVPRSELQIMKVKLQSLEEQSAEEAAAAAAAASEQQRVIEQLGKLLTTQQEECAELRARLQVRVNHVRYCEGEMICTAGASLTADEYYALYWVPCCAHRSSNTHVQMGADYISAALRLPSQSASHCHSGGAVCSGICSSSTGRNTNAGESSGEDGGGYAGGSGGGAGAAAEAGWGRLVHGGSCSKGVGDGEAVFADEGGNPGTGQAAAPRWRGG